MTKQMMILYAKVDFADDEDLCEIIVLALERGLLVRLDDGTYHAVDA